MVQRVLFYGLFLVAAGVLPYISSVWSNASLSTPAGDATAGGAISTAAAIVAPEFSHSVSSPAMALPQPVPPLPGAFPVVELAEAVRFEITISWLFQRWPRVVTGLPEGELQGYRVPLVTGTREDDIAGSLTYYFNTHQVCRRITLQGSVGDPRKLTDHAVGRFGLLRQASPDPGLHLYQTRWNGKPVSELKIKAVPVVKASAPHARYEVQMVLNSFSRN